MSLINDVLRDLERRGHPDAPRALPHTEPSARPGRRWVWWVLAAVLAGVVLHWSLGGGLSGQPAVEAPVAATEPTETVPGAAPESGDSTGFPPASSVLGVMPRAATAGEPTNAASSDGGAGNPATNSGQPPEAPGSRETVAQATAAEPVKEQSGQEKTPGEGGTARATVDASAPPEPRSSTTAPAEARGAREPEPQTASPGEDDIVIRRSGGATKPDESVDERLATAKRALGRGQRALAVSQLGDLLESAPDNLDARLLLARLYIEDGRPRAAEELLDAGLDRQPDEPGLAFLLGRLLLEQGRLSKAERVLDQHAPPVAVNPDYHLLLALTHRQAGDHDAAIVAYREVTDASPGMGAAWVGLGVSLEATGDSQGARTAYRKAVGGDDRRAAMFARQRLAVMPANPEAEEH